MQKKLIGASALIAGTCVGAATIALPVATAQFGFFGCLLLFFFSWLLMSWTGCLTLEANSHLNANASFISMAQYSLGNTAANIVLISYSCLLYVLLTAYITGGGDILINILPNDSSAGTTIWTISGLIVLALGIKQIDNINKLMLLGLAVSFIIMLIWTIANVDWQKLNNFNFSMDHQALLIIFAAFGFQVIIPTIRNYSDSNFKLVKKAIIYGSSLPLLIYISWSICIFGTIPLLGNNGLIALQQQGHLTHLIPIWMAHASSNIHLQTGVNIFIFFAIATSFLGIAISLYDFIKDIFINQAKIKKINIKWHIVILVSVLLPPWLYAHYWPNNFVKVLQNAGILVVLLNIILPIIMVLKLRYSNKKAGFTIGGNIIYLWLGLFFSLLFLFL